MELSFESCLRQLTHARVVWPLLPRWRAVGLFGVEILILVGCLVAYYLLDHDLWAIVAMFVVGLGALAVNHLAGHRWVRAFRKREGRPVADGVSFVEVARKLRIERLLSLAEQGGKRPVARVIEIEIGSTQSQIDLDKRRGFGFPSWPGKVVAPLATIGLGLIINVPPSPIEKLRLLAQFVLPMVAMGVGVFLMVPKLPTKEGQMLDYLSLLSWAKRSLDLAAVEGNVAPSASESPRDSSTVGAAAPRGEAAEAASPKAQPLEPCLL